MCTEAGTLSNLRDPMWSRETGTKGVSVCIGERLDILNILFQQLNSVSEPLSILRRRIRYRSAERGKLTGRTDVCSSFNQSNSGSHFSLVRGQILCPQKQVVPAK